MPTQELIDKLKALSPQDPDKEEDTVPYDSQSGTLANVARFMANNAMSKSNVMPAAGAVEAAPALAEGVAEAAPAAMSKIKGLIQSGRNAFAPISEEAPATLEQLAKAQNVAAEINPYTPDALMKASRFRNKLR